MKYIELNNATLFYLKKGRLDKMRVRSELCGIDKENEKEFIIGSASQQFLEGNTTNDSVKVLLQALLYSKPIGQTYYTHLTNNIRYFNPEYKQEVEDVFDLLSITKILKEKIAILLLNGKRPNLNKTVIQTKDYQYIVHDTVLS